MKNPVKKIRNFKINDIDSTLWRTSLWTLKWVGKWAVVAATATALIGVFAPPLGGLAWASIMWVGWAIDGTAAYNKKDYRIGRRVIDMWAQLSWIMRWSIDKALHSLWKKMSIKAQKILAKPNPELFKNLKGETARLQELKLNEKSLKKLEDILEKQKKQTEENNAIHAELIEKRKELLEELNKRKPPQSRKAPVSPWYIWKAQTSLLKNIPYTPEGKLHFEGFAPANQKIKLTTKIIEHWKSVTKELAHVKTDKNGYFSIDIEDFRKLKNYKNKTITIQYGARSEKFDVILP